jgi:hypothetical protein
MGNSRAPAAAAAAAAPAADEGDEKKRKMMKGDGSFYNHLMMFLWLGLVHMVLVVIGVACFCLPHPAVGIRLELHGPHRVSSTGVLSAIRPARVALTPGGCQLGHTWTVLGASLIEACFASKVKSSAAPTLPAGGGDADAPRGAVVDAQQGAVPAVGHVRRARHHERGDEVLPAVAGVGGRGRVPRRRGEGHPHGRACHLLTLVHVFTPHLSSVM